MQQLVKLFLVSLLGVSISSCSSMIASAKNKMAQDLASAIINNDDLETVKAGAPAYLIMIDSFIEGDPDNSNTLLSASKLYGSYAGVFVKEENRSKNMTQKALDFALKANCSEIPASCGLKTMEFKAFEKVIDAYTKEQVELLFTLGSSWAGWIQSRGGDWNAAADLGRITRIMQKVKTLDETYQNGQVHLYLGILNTLLPPSLGGKPDIGKNHFEKAIQLSQGKNLIAKVLYAEKYARLVFDQELHDRLLNEVLKSDPRIKGFVLTNVLAQQQAKELLASGKEYF